MKQKLLKINNRGFTLVEVLIVLGIFGVIGTIIISILFVSLRGTRKSEVSILAKQNGNLALSQMLRQIRYSKVITNPATCVPSRTVSSVTITSLFDDGVTTFSCPVGASTTISSNSASLIDDSRFTVTDCSFVCAQQDVALPPTITIKFTLIPRGANTLTETGGNFVFQSAVTQRNFNR